MYIPIRFVLHARIASIEVILPELLPYPLPFPAIHAHVLHTARTL